MYASNANDKIIDTLGYRYYHDMDNEREGSKLRMYVGKNSITKKTCIREKKNRSWYKWYLVYQSRNKILNVDKIIIHTIYTVVHIFGMYDLEYN